MRTLNQKGFEAVGIMVAIVLVAVVAFAGYKVFTMNKAADTAATSGQTGAPDTINSKADLEQTDKALSDADAELDSNLNDSQLDADVDSML